MITAGWPLRGSRGKKLQKYQKNKKRKKILSQYFEPIDIVILLDGVAVNLFGFVLQCTHINVWKILSRTILDWKLNVVERRPRTGYKHVNIELSVGSRVRVDQLCAHPPVPWQLYRREGGQVFLLIVDAAVPEICLWPRSCTVYSLCKTFWQL